VLAKVAGGVEELLRLDRRAQPRVTERHTFARRVRAAPLEPVAHRRHLQSGDLLAVEIADLAVVVGDELHATPHTVIATRA
jgi:hypothetical protein